MSAREPRRGRRRSFRDRRLRLLVVCGGALTEPAYFNGLKACLRNPAVHVDIRMKGRAPRDVVNYASNLAKTASRNGDEFDEVWCVLDVDNFPYGSTIALAKETNVRLAVSNPCFELWLLLHYQDQRAPLCNVKAVEKLLGRHVSDYDKKVRFSDFESGVENALRRAKSLDSTGHNYGRDPSSGVWKLVQQMKKGG